MSSFAPIPCQIVSASVTPCTPQRADPLAHTALLLRQFEESLTHGDSEQAQRANQAILALSRLLEPAQARQIERQIEQIWQRVCGFRF